MGNNDRNADCTQQHKPPARPPRQIARALGIAVEQWRKTCDCKCEACDEFVGQLALVTVTLLGDDPSQFLDETLGKEAM